MHPLTATHYCGYYLALTHFFSVEHILQEAALLHLVAAADWEANLGVVVSAASADSAVGAEVQALLPLAALGNLAHHLEALAHSAALVPLLAAVGHLSEAVGHLSEAVGHLLGVGDHHLVSNSAGVSCLVRYRPMIIGASLHLLRPLA